MNYVNKRVLKHILTSSSEIFHSVPLCIIWLNTDLRTLIQRNETDAVSYVIRRTCRDIDVLLELIVLTTSNSVEISILKNILYNMSWTDKDPEDFIGCTWKIIAHNIMAWLLFNPPQKEKTRFILETFHFLYEDESLPVVWMEIACRSGNVDVVRDILCYTCLKDKPYYLKAVKCGLNEAVYRSHRHVVEFLADILPSSIDYQILLGSCAFNNFEIFEFLITRADSCHLDQDSIMKYAYTSISGKNIEIFKNLIRRLQVVNSDVFLINACQCGHTELVKYLTNECIPRADPTVDDMLCLKCACEDGCFETVRYLCGLPEVDLSTDDHHHCLELASGNGHLQIVRFLAEIPGVDVSAEAIYKAITRSHLDVVKFLCSCVDPFSYGNKVFEVACLRGYLDVVKFLTTLPTCVITSIAFKNACCSNNLELVKFLASFPNILNKKTRIIREALTHFLAEKNHGSVSDDENIHDYLLTLDKMETTMK